MMLVMAVLLVLCVGAVSAADAGAADNQIIVEDASSNITVDVPSSVDVDIDNKDVKFNIVVKDGNETLNVTKDDLKLNLTVNGSYVPLGENNTNFTFENSVISFKIPVDFTTASLDVLYNNTFKSTIELNPIVSNKMDIPGYVVIDNNKKVEFDLNVTDKNNNTLNFTEDDLIIIMKYLGDESNNYTYTVENYTLNGTKITFTLNNITGNFTQGQMSIFYKNDTIDKATLDKTVYFCKINVLTDECGTQYQYNPVVAQLWNIYLNEPVVNATMTFLFKNASVQWAYPGIATDKDGKTNRTLDFLNNLLISQGYVGVGSNYVVVVSSDLAWGQQVTLNISAASAKFTASDYNQYYGSGKKFNIKFMNSKYNTPINGVIKLTIYQGKYNSKTKKYTYTTKLGDFYAVSDSSTGLASIGVNLGAGKYKVVISNYDKGNITASSITRYMTIKKISSAKLSAKTTTVYYNNGNKFAVKLTTSKGVPLKGATVILNVYTGSKYKAVQLTTNDNGYAYWTVSGIGIGTHKVLIGTDSSSAPASVIQTYIIVKKGKTVVTAPKVTTTKGKSTTFNITVVTSGTKKAINNLPLTVKLYKSGKYYKTFSLKTNSKGFASFNTKSLAKGTYTVKITSTSSYYTVSKSSTIVIN